MVQRHFTDERVDLLQRVDGIVNAKQMEFVVFFNQEVEKVKAEVLGWLNKASEKVQEVGVSSEGHKRILRLKLEVFVQEKFAEFSKDFQH